MTDEQKAILNAFIDYHNKHMDKGFDGADFAKHMEPIFAEMGFRKQVTPKDQQKILVFRDDAAGDFVLNSAFMRELRRIYPTAKITLFSSYRNIELARCCPYVDNIIENTIKERTLPFWIMFRDLAEYAVKELLPYHFDLSFSGRLGIKSLDVILAYLAGVNCRVAFTQDRPAGEGKMGILGWDPLISVPVPMPSKLVNDAENDLSLLEHLLHLPIADRHLEVWTVDADREAAARAMEPLRKKKNVKRIYSVMTSASEEFREPPLDRFIDLLNEIVKNENDVGFVFLGGPGERDKKRAKTLASKFRDRSISLAGKLKFRVSAEVVGMTEKYIGVDTALMHVATAKKIPVLGTFPFPASLGMHPMSCPVRFQPYKVPAVIVLPPAPKTDNCNLVTGTGCANKEGRPCCITGITAEKLILGYNILSERIKTNNIGALIMK